MVYTIALSRFTTKDLFWTGVYTPSPMVCQQSVSVMQTNVYKISCNELTNNALLFIDLFLKMLRSLIRSFEKKLQC